MATQTATFETYMFWVHHLAEYVLCTIEMKSPRGLTWGTRVGKHVAYPPSGYPSPILGKFWGTGQVGHSTCGRVAIILSTTSELGATRSCSTWVHVLRWCLYVCTLRPFTAPRACAGHSDILRASAHAYATCHAYNRYAYRYLCMCVSSIWCVHMYVPHMLYLAPVVDRNFCLNVWATYGCHSYRLVTSITF